MKLKSILLTALATISLATATMAQVPNYLPTNGLVGWWPFNGNANDESGNGNNGINNGISYTLDRFGNANKALLFVGTPNHIAMPSGSSSSLNITGNITVSIWYNCISDIQPILQFNDGISGTGGYGLTMGVNNPNKISFFTGNDNWYGTNSNNQINGNWHNVVVALSAGNLNIYFDGILDVSYSGVLSPVSWNGLRTLGMGNNASGLEFNGNYYDGKLDDIGIWNRALTQQEITDLYNATNCSNNTSVNPQINTLNTGAIATFTATTSDPNPSYVWQSDFGQGFQTLNNFGNYSGVNSATLNIANVQLSEHNQPIRVISTSGNCIDTSNVAVINILDTCITSVTVYDTLLTTVTDTLLINATITGLNPPNNQNTLKIFPNPTNTHITINYGNFNSMSGYTLKIVNAIGQTVFTTPINQQTSYIDLSTWTGNGIYYVQLIDTQNNTIENRKIVIQ